MHSTDNSVLINKDNSEIIGNFLLLLLIATHFADRLFIKPNALFTFNAQSSNRWQTITR